MIQFRQIIDQFNLILQRQLKRAVSKLLKLDEWKVSKWNIIKCYLKVIKTFAANEWNLLIQVGYIFSFRDHLRIRKQSRMTYINLVFESIVVAQRLEQQLPNQEVVGSNSIGCRTTWITKGQPVEPLSFWGKLWRGEKSYVLLGIRTRNHVTGTKKACLHSPMKLKFEFLSLFLIGSSFSLV